MYMYTVLLLYYRYGPQWTVYIKSQGGSIIRVYSIIYTTVELHVLYSAAPLRLYTRFPPIYREFLRHVL